MLTHDYDQQQRQLDRLVDGELPDSERRQFIASLDELPDGWRRCALAFLEAQSWEDDLGAIAHAEPARTPPIAASPLTTVRAQSWLHRPSLGALTTLAAGVMVCFALGISADRWFDPPSSGYKVLERNAEGLPLAAVGNQPDHSGMAESPTAEHLTLVLGEGRDDVVPVQVPIVKDPALAAGWLNSSPPLPADVRQALERLGGRVREHRQLIPVRMGDGREVVVPVDRIDLQPVNLKDYQ